MSTIDSHPNSYHVAALSGSVAAMNLNRELSFGITGQDVRILQDILNDSLEPSPRLVEDGIFGYQTELAVMRFQAGHDLVVDGIVGPKTWNALLKGEHQPAVRAAAAGHSGSGSGQGAWNGPSYHSQAAHAGQGAGYGSGVAARSNVPHKRIPKVIHENNVAQHVHLVRRGGRVVPHFWQGDPRWGACAVGSGRNMACIGCGVTSVAMVLGFFGKQLDPGSLNQWLIRNGGYVGCAVNWRVAFQAHAREGVHLTVANPMYTNVRDFRRILLSRIEKNLPTLVDVDYGRDRDQIGNHYVVIAGCTPDGRLIMNDPATPAGNGALHWQDRQNCIETTTRASGYRIVSLCLVNPA